MTTNLEICLVRHGQTEHNVAARLQGWCDSPLTAEGEEAAAALGRAVPTRDVQTFWGAMGCGCWAV